MSPIDQSDRPAVSVSDTATPGGRCPACGQPLFAWLDPPGTDPVHRDARYVIDRCENCGLALERGDGGEGLAATIERIVHEARAAGDGETTIELPNGASLQAGLGTENWAALRLPAEPFVVTPRSLELLAEHEGLEVARLSYPARPAMAAMLGTIFNLLTFNRDFARSAARRELRPRDSRAGWPGYVIDAVVTILTAIPAAILAVLIEGAAIVARRGGVLRATLRRRRR